MADSMDGNGHMARFTSFKYKGREKKDFRRQRMETSVELRKQKKHDTLLKRSSLGVVEEDPTTPLKEQEKDVTISLSEIISGMNSSDHDLNTKATACLRKILSQDDPPIDKVIEAGLVKLLVNFLGYEDSYLLQCEAAWALTNIASGTSEHTQVVVEAGAVPEFIRLLDSPVASIIELSVWALGNIAGDGPDLRDYITRSGIIEPLLRIINESIVQPDFLHTVAWTISNLFRSKSPPPLMQTIKSFLPSLRSLIEYTDNSILMNTCWALAYATDGAIDQIQLVVDYPGMLARLVELLSSSHPLVVAAALRTVGNIVAGDESQTQAVINCKLLDTMPALLRHPEAKIIKEACWVLSNITAGSTEQIQVVIDCNLLPLLIAVLIAGNFNSQKEATWVFTNLSKRGTLEQVVYIHEVGAFEPLCDLLTTKDPMLMFLLLDGICNILTAAKLVGKLVPVCLLLEEIGLDKIQQLQNHENNHISNKAQEIFVTFFTVERTDNQPASEREFYHFHF